MESPIQADYRAICEARRLTCTLTYGGGANAKEPVPKQPSPSLQKGGNPLLAGPFAMLLVFGAFIGIAALWLRFGGGGVLLSQVPAEDRRPVVRPDRWQAEETPQGGGFDYVLKQIEAMADRREAVIRLLHHCLLHAAQASGTQFKRSDTERSAFARLPETMQNRQTLLSMLGEAELVHYGGRDVEDTQFARLLSAARTLIHGEARAHG